MRIFLTLPRHDSCIEHTVQNLHLQCASLLETFSVSVRVDTPLTLSVQNTESVAPRWALSVQMHEALDT